MGVVQPAQHHHHHHHHGAGPGPIRRRPTPHPNAISSTLFQIHQEHAVKHKPDHSVDSSDNSSNSNVSGASSCSSNVSGAGSSNSNASGPISNSLCSTTASSASSHLSNTPRSTCNITNRRTPGQSIVSRTRKTTTPVASANKLINGINKAYGKIGNASYSRSNSQPIDVYIPDRDLNGLADITTSNNNIALPEKKLLQREIILPSCTSTSIQTSSPNPAISSRVLLQPSDTTPCRDLYQENGDVRLRPALELPLFSQHQHLYYSPSLSPILGL